MPLVMGEFSNRSPLSLFWRARSSEAGSPSVEDWSIAKLFRDKPVSCPANRVKSFHEVGISSIESFVLLLVFPGVDRG